MSAANRSRGARAEVSVVNFLRSVGYDDARRYLAGDGRQPGDIDWHPLICLEVKDRASSSWPSWCRQASAEAREGQVPVVVRRLRGERNVAKWPARLPLGSLVMVGVGRSKAMAGLPGLWVETTFGLVVNAVAAHDGNEGTVAALRLVLGVHGVKAGE